MYQLSEMRLPRVSYSVKKSILFDLLNRDPDPIPGGKPVTFQGIDIEPQGFRLIMGPVLGHETILVFIYMPDKFQFGGELYLFRHAENEWKREIIRLSD
jgi:hypothetical protein